MDRVLICCGQVYCIQCTYVNAVPQPALASASEPWFLCRSTGDAQTAAAAPSWATGPQSGSWQRLPPAAGGAESASEPPRMQVTTWRGRRGGNMCVCCSLLA